MCGIIPGTHPVSEIAVSYKVVPTVQLTYHKENRLQEKTDNINKQTKKRSQQQ